MARSISKAEAEKQIKSFFGLWKRNSVSWREEARTAHKFYAGEQWSVDDRAFLEENLRPVITFNRVAPFIDAITGNAINTRTRITYLPRQPQNSTAARALSEVARWVLEKSPANEETRAFTDALIGGVGWIGISMDYDKNPDGDIRIERIDPFEMLWDTRAATIDDLRFVARERWTDKDEAKDLFGSALDELLPDNDDPLDEVTRPLDANKMWKYQESFTAPSEKHVGKIRVIEWQFWTREPVTFAVTPNGLVEVDAKQVPEGIETIKQSRRVFHRAFSIGERVIEVGLNPFPRGFSIIPIFGKHDQNQNIFYGLMRGMKDAQEWSNKFFSQLQMIINSNAKGGLFAELDAFDNVRKAESEYAQPNSITWLRPNGLTKIREKGIAPYPAGVAELLGFAVGALREVTGINLEYLGMASREQARILEVERKQSAMNILSIYFDNLRVAKIELGRVLLHFIRSYLADGRIVRLGQNQAIPLIRDQFMESEYDIIVEEAPESPNLKRQVWAEVTPLLPILASFQAPPEVMVELLRFSPLPQETVDAMVRSVQESAQREAQMQAMELQIKQTAAAAKAQPQAQSQPQESPIDIANKQAEIALKDAKAQQARASAMKAQTEAITKLYGE